MRPEFSNICFEAMRSAKVVDAGHLADGEPVDILVTASSPAPRRSAVDILAEAPGHRLFETAQDVIDHLESERDSWGP